LRTPAAAAIFGSCRRRFDTRKPLPSGKSGFFLSTLNGAEIFMHLWATSFLEALWGNGLFHAWLVSRFQTKAFRLYIFSHIQTKTFRFHISLCFHSASKKDLACKPAIYCVDSVRIDFFVLLFE
jgi:hypothetical protein